MSVNAMNAVQELVQGARNTAGVGPEEALIEVVDLHKYYEMGDTRVHALRGIRLEIRRGEFVAIMGASGSGKSTFMNLLGCLDKPSSGTYLLDGTNVADLSRIELAHIRNERVGFVFQGFNLLSRTTALENVELPLIYARIRARERRRLAQEALLKVGLGERIHHVPSQLSGGQQQRVAIARSLVNRPSILLADEPTGNLDSRTSVEIMQVFQELNERESLTIILVTHEPDIAEYGKRIITFRDGQIVKDQPVLKRRIASEILANMSPVED
jgi:putative ABC transport system ATP-binding protein